MENALAEIIKVEGTVGVLLLGPKGEIIARAPEAGWEVKDLGDLLDEVELTFACLRLSGEEVDEIDFCFDSTRMVARKLAGSVLIAFCRPDVDLALLRMTMNITVAQIKEQTGVYTLLTRKWIGPDLSGQDLAKIYEDLRQSDPGEVHYA